jgi:hypothetical protein
VPDNEPPTSDPPSDDAPDADPPVDRSADRSVGPGHMPTRPGVSLIDAGLGAGYLASRIAAVPLRVAAHTGRNLADPARRALAAPAAHGVTDLASWVLRTFAQVGAPQRAHAERRVRVLLREATYAVTKNRAVSRLVNDLASPQLEPLIDEALPIVLARLAEQPDEIQKIVQEQSRGIVSEARDTARQGARRGDDVVDSVVDRLLRRRAGTTDTSSGAKQPQGSQGPHEHAP